MLSTNNCINMSLLTELASSGMNDAERLTLLANLIDDIDAVICAKNIDGKHFLVNKCYETAVGIHREHVFGKTDEEIFLFEPQAAKAIREKDLEVIRTANKLSFEEQVPCSDGHLKYYLTKKSPILNTDSEVIGVMCLAVDISTQKKLELELQKATSAKNLFLAKMSHEIRTPISAIAGYVDLMHHSDASKHSSYLNNINISIEHLLNLVNDILDISSIEESKIELNHKKFDLLMVLDSVVSTLKLKSNTHKIKLITKLDKEHDRYYVGDETRIKQIILNLASNALKFSKGEPITICLSVINSRYPQKKKVSVLVKDNGIGMNTTDREKLFKSFSQLKSSEHYFEGTGLGLAIVKELSQLMQGSVKIFSREGKGTLAAVSMHLEHAEPPQLTYPELTITHSDEIPSDKVKPLSGKTICIAEDQIFNREILKSMAQSEGAEVIAFEDGVNLINAIEANQLPNQIDCFLLDIHMPVMGGIDTLNAIRKYHQYQNTPAYFITADAIKDNLERYWAENYNLSGIFIKPLKRQELISCVVTTP